MARLMPIALLVRSNLFMTFAWFMVFSVAYLGEALTSITCWDSLSSHLEPHSSSMGPSEATWLRRLQ